MTFITVAIFHLPQDAYIIKARLESEGIPVFLKDEYSVQTENFLSNAIGGVKLQVDENDALAATEILKAQGVELPGDSDKDHKGGLKKDQKVIAIFGLLLIVILFLFLYFNGSLDF